ncbi:gluconate 2-dehydrogenase subunit 3 family protein [Halorubrum sp. CBA1125]|uniref:gluconate 2-dehydrogenase subunit 3 family protein n=1 Tax=Halorubrum sp. CBA1125 TaxID=2668072 RepID=UPI0037445743
MTAVARTVYPEAASGIESFVDGFLDGRLDGSAHAEGIRAAVAEVESAARSWYDAPVAELPAAERDDLLRELGADTAEENPHGTTAERVRYYVVNDLLLALYASPTGGELVGIENPQGYAGGAESYTRGPP